MGYAPPCPGFQPWENHAWWWSRFKEPPTRPSLLLLLLRRVLHLEREQGEETSLLWGNRGPLDSWEVVVKVVSWDCGTKPSAGVFERAVFGPPSAPAVRAANSFRAGLPHQNFTGSRIETTRAQSVYCGSKLDSV